MRFYLVSVSSSGYHCRAAFSAESPQEAARIHVNAHKGLRTANALVMRHEDGKRSSFWDSAQVLKVSY